METRRVHSVLVREHGDLDLAALPVFANSHDVVQILRLALPLFVGDAKVLKNGISAHTLQERRLHQVDDVLVNEALRLTQQKHMLLVTLQ